MGLEALLAALPLCPHVQARVPKLYSPVGQMGPEVANGRHITRATGWQGMPRDRPRTASGPGRG